MVEDPKQLLQLATEAAPAVEDTVEKLLAEELKLQQQLDAQVNADAAHAEGIVDDFIQQQQA